jgi:hypothetical protein
MATSAFEIGFHLQVIPVRNHSRPLAFDIKHRKGVLFKYWKVNFPILGIAPMLQIKFVATIAVAHGPYLLFWFLAAFAAWL